MLAEPILGVFVGIAGGIPFATGIINHDPLLIAIGIGIIVAWLVFMMKRRKDNSGEKRNAN